MLKLVLLICLASIQYASSQFYSTCNYGYTIKSGDTCYNIAQTYGTTVDALVASNPGLNCYNLQVGQGLNVNSNAFGTYYNGYSVRSGDSCYSIASYYGISVTDLQNANPGINCNNLQIGQTLNVNIYRNANVNTNYVIKSGDTCAAIAASYRISVDQLVASNPGVNCWNLQPGQSLFLNSGSYYNNYNYNYGVRLGDTCYSIATAYGLTLNQFYALNPTVNCNSLNIGQQLNLNSGSVGCGSYGTGGYYYGYRVISGDTCSSIAYRYGITLNDLYAKNPGINCNNLQIGQQVNV